MKTVNEILARKARAGVIAVSVGATVFDAVHAMDQGNTGAVVVLDGDRLAGIFTERDLMRRVVMKGRDIGGTPVADVMTRDLLYTEPGEAAENAMAKMTRHRCRHLPVIEGEQLVGVLSIGDLMKEISEEQDVEIRFLKEYIYSR
ncbi:MAG: CBS domain-containing protein [Candidatus Binatia bacterium]